MRASLARPISDSPKELRGHGGIVTARRGRAIVASLLGLLSTLICLSGSWVPSLWGDEAASLLSARRTLPSLWSMLQHVDVVHGAYYLGLHVWVDVAGTSAFALRLPSAVAIGATTIAVVILGSRLRDDRTAVLAGIIMCVLPRLTYVGEEARSFAFSAALVSWATVAFVFLLDHRHPARRWGVVYGALATVSILVFAFSALVIAAHALVVAAHRLRGRRLGVWLTAAVSAIVLSLPLGVIAFAQRDQVAYLATREQTSMYSIAVFMWFGTVLFAVIAWLLILIAAASAVIRWRRAGTIHTPSMPSLELVAVAWLVIPPGVLIGTHPLLHAFTARYLAFCAPAAALLMAIAIDRIWSWRREAGLIALAAVVASALPAYLAQRTSYAKNDSDWAAVSAVLGARAHPGDAVLFDEQARPSRRPRLAYRTYPSGFRDVTDIALAIPYWRNSTWYDSAYPADSRQVTAALATTGKVWLIDDVREQTDPPYGVAALRSAGFHVTDEVRTHTSVLREFTR